MNKHLHCHVLENTPKVSWSYLAHGNVSQTNNHEHTLKKNRICHSTAKCRGSDARTVLWLFIGVTWVECVCVSLVCVHYHCGGSVGERAQQQGQGVVAVTANMRLEHNLHTNKHNEFLSRSPRKHGWRLTHDGPTVSTNWRPKKHSDNTLFQRPEWWYFHCTLFWHAHHLSTLTFPQDERYSHPPFRGMVSGLRPSSKTWCQTRHDTPLAGNPVLRSGCEPPQ